MRKLFLPLAMLALVVSGCMGHSSKSQCCVADKSKQKLLRHVVLFSFKEESTPQDIKKVEDAFSALADKIEVIKDFEFGTDVGVEGLSKGFTHCFFVTFENEAGRAEYLPHPDHKAFGEILGPHLKDVLVIDYWTQK